jgi:hypothetical protein
VRNSPQRSVFDNRRVSLEDKNENNFNPQFISVETPYLGEKGDEINHSQNNISSGGYLEKNHSSVGSYNHLYKFKAPMMNYVNQKERLSAVQPHKNHFNSTIRQPTNLGLKRGVQRTPISSNLKNYIEGFKFETPVNNNSSKLTKFTTPSSGGESITTATSMRKLPNRMSPNYNPVSPAESVCGDSIIQDSGLIPKFTPKSTTKELMRVSLERIDNAVKRYGTKINPSEMPSPFEIANTVSNLHLRQYLWEEENSMVDEIKDSQKLIPQRKLFSEKQAFSEQVTNSIICESETQDIENFTLGPAQFSNINLITGNKGKSSKNLLSEFQKEHEKGRTVIQGKRKEGVL